MLDDLHALYQELILDHSKAPRNFGALPEANCEAEGYNPLCGDQINVHLLMENGVVKDVRFEGSGCAISVASASLMTDMVKGKKEQEAKALFDAFHALVTGKTPEGMEDAEQLDKLVALAGVQHFPMRVKCATLAWHTLDAAFKHQEKVSTE